MSTETKNSQYLLLLRHPGGETPPREVLEPIMVRFAAWMKDLNERKLVAGNNGLEMGGKVLRGPRGATISDGPYPESKEIVGGYVLLNVESLEQAVEAARNCPGLDYGMVVEVRPVRRR